MWRPTITQNGWWPRLSPDGLKLAFGNTECYVADFRHPAKREQLLNGNRAWHAFWISDDLLTFFQERPSLDGWIRYTSVPPPTSNLDSDWGSFFREYVPVTNTLDGDGPHWAANRPWNETFVDGALYPNGIGCNGVSCAGDFLLQLAPQGSNALRLHNLAQSIFLDFIPKGSANEFIVNDQGWCGFGYNGPVFIRVPNGEQFDITVTPWRKESVPHLVRVGMTTWAWTGTQDPASGESLILGRPLVGLPADPGDGAIIIKGMGSASLSVRYRERDREFVIAGCDANGSLGVETCPIDAPLEALEPRCPPFPKKFFLGTFFSFSNPEGSSLTHPYGSTTDYPQNCTVVVNPEVIPLAVKYQPLIVSAACIQSVRDSLARDRVIGLYISPESGAPAAETQARDAKRQWTSLIGGDPPPVIWYVTPGEPKKPDWLIPPSVDVFAPELYFNEYSITQERMEELLWRMLGNWLSVLPLDKPWFPVCQAFDRARPTEVDMQAVAAMQPAFLRKMVELDTRIGKLPPAVGLLFFAVNRPGGAKQYPMIRRWHKAMLESLPPGVPELRPKKENPTMYPPLFTISEPTFPLRAKGSITFRCVYKLETGSGPLETIQWEYREASSDVWLIAARNPGDDFDHTFKISRPGTYYIRAIGENSAGEHTTTKQRQVTVEKVDSTEPPSPTPQPPLSITLDQFKQEALQVSQAFWDVKKQVPSAPTLYAFAWERLRDGKTHEAILQEIKSLQEPPQTPPPPIGGKFSVAFNVRDKSGRGIPSLVTDLSTGEKQQTNEHGFCAFNSVSGGVHKFRLESEGFTTREIELDVVASHERTEILERPFSGKLAGRVRISNRSFVNDDGLFRPRFSSGLYLLSKDTSPATEFMDWVAQNEFNGFRVFAGDLGQVNQTPQSALERLPFMVEYAQSRGLYVLVTPLTGTSKGYDVEDHLRQINSILVQFDNTLIELANEPYHASQSEKIHDFNYLKQLTTWISNDIVVALGAPEYDEPQAITPGKPEEGTLWGPEGGPAIQVAEWQSVHLNRDRQGFERARRVRESEAVSSIIGRPVILQEHAKFLSQEGNPSIAFCLGVLGCVFEVGMVLHTDFGLEARLPSPSEQVIVNAFIAGSNLVTTKQRLTFKNASWGDSPIRKFDGAVRVYSGVSSEQSLTVALGISGSLQIETQNGWRLGDLIAEMPGIQVFELLR